MKNMFPSPEPNTTTRVESYPNIIDTDNPSRCMPKHISSIENIDLRQWPEEGYASAGHLSSYTNPTELGSSSLPYLPSDFFQSFSYGSSANTVPSARSHESIPPHCLHLHGLSLQSNLAGGGGGGDHLRGLLLPLGEAADSCSRGRPSSENPRNAYMAASPDVANHSSGRSLVTMLPYQPPAYHTSTALTPFQPQFQRQKPPTDLAESPGSINTQASYTMSSSHGEDVKINGSLKQRSKKESHNRIERKRRDYINSQISRLSGLLPTDLYRDVEGRRNKGTVLRLSVNYLMELRQLVTLTSSLNDEVNLGRQLIPRLLKYIQVLEAVLLAGSNSPKEGSDYSHKLFDFPPEGAYTELLEAWRRARQANVMRPVSGSAMVGLPVDGRRQATKVAANYAKSTASDIRCLPLPEHLAVSYASRTLKEEGFEGATTTFFLDETSSTVDSFFAPSHEA